MNDININEKWLRSRNFDSSFHIKHSWLVLVFLNMYLSEGYARDFCKLFKIPTKLLNNNFFQSGRFPAFILSNNLKIFSFFFGGHLASRLTNFLQPAPHLYYENSLAIQKWGEFSGLTLLRLDGESEMNWKPIRP